MPNIHQDPRSSYPVVGGAISFPVSPIASGIPSSGGGVIAGLTTGSGRPPSGRSPPLGAPLRIQGDVVGGVMMTAAHSPTSPTSAGGVRAPVGGGSQSHHGRQSLQHQQLPHHHGAVAQDCYDGQKQQQHHCQTQQQLLPPTCGARQLSKLKRFLTTLQQFAIDISPETGNHVRSLVLALVNNHLSVEEFHAKLQHATNFPLRPFVIPFLKANLPLLQREMLHCAQLARQTPYQYVTSCNDRIVLDTVTAMAAATSGNCNTATSADPMTSPLPDAMLDPMLRDADSPSTPVLMSAGVKRQSSTLKLISSETAGVKRHRTISPSINSSSNNSSPVSLRCHDDGAAVVLPDNHDVDDAVAPPLLVPGDVTRTDLCLQQDAATFQSRTDKVIIGNRNDRNAVSSLPQLSASDPILDDLKNVEALLHGVVGMVDQCKTVISGLREKWQSLSVPSCSDINTLSAVNQKTVLDAVNEVKRKAVVELQRAVDESHATAERLLAAERSRLQVAMTTARKQAMDELLLSIRSQPSSPESCWNCGRKATETCSRCKVACYCSSACQHRDWTSHQYICRHQTMTGSDLTGDRSAHSPPSSPPLPLPVSSESAQKQDVLASDETRPSAPGGGDIERPLPDADSPPGDVSELVKSEQLN